MHKCEDWKRCTQYSASMYSYIYIYIYIYIYNLYIIIFFNGQWTENRKNGPPVTEKLLKLSTTVLSNMSHQSTAAKIEALLKFWMQTLNLCTIQYTLEGTLKLPGCVMPLGEGRQLCPPQRIPWSPQWLGQSNGCASFPGRFPSFFSWPCLPPVQGQTWLCGLMLEAVIVSHHVASQSRSLPWAQGVMVILSGHLPLEEDSPCGSNTDGMLALVRDCLMTIFKWLWWGTLPALLRQLKPCYYYINYIECAIIYI